MSDFTQDLFSSRRNFPDGDTRIGDLGRIWYDSKTNTFRLGDGNPGGQIIGGGGGSGNYVLPTASTSVKGGVKIDGATIQINNQVISVGTVPYSSISGTPTIPTVPTNVSAFNNDSGYITEANVVTYLINNPQPGTYSNANVASYMPVYGGDISASNIVASNLTGTIQTAAQPHITTVGTLNGLTINSTTGGNFFTISGAANPGFGNPQTWRFFSQPNIFGGTAGSWIQFPDSTYQYTAYPGTATSSNIGGVQPDNSTITISGGVISADFSSINTKINSYETFANTWLGNLQANISNIVGITSASATTGNLLITLSNAAVIDAGNVRGAKGDQGLQGIPGQGGVVVNWLNYVSTVNQSVAQSSVGIPIQWETKRASYGMDVTTDGSGKYTNIVIPVDGTYLFNFTLQVDFTGGGGSGKRVEVWKRLNGVDVAQTGRSLDISSSTVTNLLTTDYINTYKAGDVVQWMWASDNTNVSLAANQNLDSNPMSPSTKLICIQLAYQGIQGNTGVSVTTANVTAGNLLLTLSNGFVINTGSISTYSNVNVASYLVANPQAGTYSNANVASYLVANPQAGTYSNANVTSYLTTNPISTLKNGSYTATLDSTGQLELPQYTQGGITAGWVTVVGGNVGLNAGGNLWKFGSDGTMTSPYSVKVLTNGIGFPDNTTQTTAWTGTQANITYQPGSTVGAAIQISAKGTQGGTNYADFLKVTNTAAGATNPNKWFRIDNAGTLEVINSGYTTSLLSLTNTGGMSVQGPISVNGLQAVNGPSFQAFLLQAQQFTTGTTANVVYQGALYDTHSCYNTSTGVFKPNVAGYYQFNWTAGANSYPASSGIVLSSLRRNNAEYARGYRGVCNTGGMVSNGSAQCYLNGTTDYVTITFLQGSGGTAYLENDTNAITNNPPGSYCNYFSGSMVRGA